MFFSLFALFLSLALFAWALGLRRPMLALHRFRRRYLTPCLWRGVHTPDRTHLYFPVGDDGERLIAHECARCGRYVSADGKPLVTSTPSPR